MSLNYVNLVVDLYDGQGVPVQAGSLTFTPNTTLTDTVDHATIAQAPITVSLAGNPLPVVQLLATDNADLSPAGWSWLVSYFFPGALARRLFLLPFSAGGTQYLSGLTPALLEGFLPLSGGTVDGALTLTGTPPLAIPAGAVAGYRLTADVSGNVSWQAPETGWFNVRKYGAAGNAQQVTDGAMSASSATLTCSTSHLFTPACAGMTVLVNGAGVAGGDLLTTIASYQSTSQVTLTAAATTAVSGARVTFGADDTAEIQAATTAMLAFGGAGLYFPAAPGYLTTASVTGTNVGNGIKVFGDGNGSLIYATGSYDVLHFASGTGITVCDLQIQGLATAPTAGAAVSINSIADYRVDRVTAGGCFYGVHTSGGTSKTANLTNSYIDAYAIGMYCPGSMTAIGGHIGGGAIGLIWDSGSGHSARLSRVGLYGPLPLTTRPGGNLGNSTQNKTIWIEAVEFNYQTGLGSGALAFMQGTETPGGANLDWCGGDIHITDPWLTGSGLTIGGGTIATGGRTDTACTITSGSTTVLDPACISGDAGATVTGPGIPSGVTVATVSAGVSFTLSAAATSTITGNAALNIGGTPGPIAPNWITIQGGNAGGNSLTLPNGIHIRSGNQVSINNMNFTGAAAHTSGSSGFTAGGSPSYSDIVLDSAVTGPVAITGNVFGGNSWWNIDSQVTSGPVVISGNAFGGFSAAVPVNMATPGAHRLTGNGGMADLTASFALTDASTISVNAALGNYATVTLGGNRTMGAPSNPLHGQGITFAVKQDGTGSRTLTWNAAYIFTTSMPAPTLSTAAGTVDEIAFRYDSGGGVWRCQGYVLGYAS